MGSLWNRSGMVERYGADDIKAAGALAYFFSGGTTTPLTVYEDAAEAAAHTHPVEADSNGRWPDVFVPYIESYDVQVKTAEGVQITYTQLIPNPDPIDLSVTIPADNQVQTGMIHAEFVNTTRSGYVRLNGRTMGNGASGGTERANADTEDLFIYMWNNLSDTIAAVSGGRGASGAADYAANKTIVLPGCRGTALIGLDDMGNSAASTFAGLTFTTGNSTTSGSFIGANARTLDTTNLPSHSHTGTTNTEGAHTHSGTTSSQNANHTHSGTSSSDGSHSHGGSTSSNGSHTHSYNDSTATTQNATSAGVNPPGVTVADVGRTTGSDGSHTHSITTDSQGSHTHTMTTGVESANHQHTFTTGGGSAHSHTFTTNAAGSSTAFNNLGQARLVTWYIKL